MTLEQARAFWLERQGLVTPASKDPVEALAHTGWARTLGGVDVYFAVRARCPSLSREALDEAVGRGAVRVAPAVRGCIYLVPAVDVPLVMALAADLSRRRTELDLAKAGSSFEEVEAVVAEVEKALAAGPLTTQAIRKALPEGAVRSLGPAGKKVGLSSPLPVALRQLEFRAEIERLPIGARLDTERYEWSLAPDSSASVPADFAGRAAAVARRFFEFFAPATLDELAAWVGIGKRDAKAAMAELPLVPVAVEGHAAEAWVLEEDREALAAAAPGAGGFSFLPFEDNLLSVHGGPRLFTDPGHHGHPVAAWASAKPTTLGEARHVHQRPLLLGGRVIGFWEYDPDTEEVVAGTFEPVPKAYRAELEAARGEIAAFIREKLGHARSFSLDTDDAVRARAAALRKMG